MEGVKIREISDPKGRAKTLYPLGKCRICQAQLTRTDPLDICYRCQDRGMRGNPRKPIKPEASKKGGRF